MSRILTPVNGHVLNIFHAATGFQAAVKTKSLIFFIRGCETGVMAGPGRKPTVSDDEILREFALDRAPFMHPTELAETLDMSRQGVYERLKDLEEKGLLASKKTGGARNWWLTDKGRAYISAES